MKMNNQRQIILDDIKRALQTPSQVWGLYQNSQQQLESAIKAARPRNIAELWEQFKNNLQEVSGEFYHLKTIDNAFHCIFLQHESRYLLLMH